jgi:hypothetical protein
MTGEPAAEVPKANHGSDLVVPVLAFGFLCYFFYSISGLAWEARANGTVIGSILFLLIGMQFARSLLAARATREFGFAAFLSVPSLQLQRILLLAFAAAFVALLPWLGVTLGIFLLLLAGMWVTGVRDRKTLFGVSIGLAAGVYVLFVLLLRTRYPAGPIERLLGYLIGA